MLREKVLELLRLYTGHPYAELLPCGNDAILAALRVCAKLRRDRDTALIPDQGGWLSYRSYPRRAGLQVVELKTDQGVLEPDVLEETLGRAQPNCLLYQNPAGYYAEQLSEEIAKICKDRCTVILDATGGLGDRCMCRGADIMVASFGRWKPVNLGKGGMVSFKDKFAYNAFCDEFGGAVFDDALLKSLLDRLQALPARMAGLYSISSKIKKELAAYQVLHPEKKGINVVVAFSSSTEKAELVRYCETNKYEYTVCPRYIRVLREALSIEVKRHD